MAAPASPADWLVVASNRAGDATVLRDGLRHHGAVYVIGYWVECAAKAWVWASTRSLPTSTHSIVDLISQGGLALSDLPSDLRSFAVTRDVALRYELQVPGSWEIDYDRAVQLGTRFRKMAEQAIRQGRRGRRR